MGVKEGRWTAIAVELGEEFSGCIAEHDAHDRFVAGNYAALRERKLFSAMVPEELGGGGASYDEMCEVVRILASHCSSTGLAFSMHQHLVATFRLNFVNGKPGEKPLRAVAEKELVLVSTGAGDWLASKGEAVKVDGGFKVNARKGFASGSPAGNLLVTSVPYKDPVEGWQVLHCPVPLSAEGVSIHEDWFSHGMCATGSNTVELENVFVPEEAVVMRRPRGEWHPFWDTVATVALPIIMSAYLGVAEAAARMADEQCKKMGDDGVRVPLLGEMHNHLTIARDAHAAMVANVENFAVAATLETADASLRRKTIVANATEATVDKAVEAVGGAAYYRKLGLERLQRDIRAGHFHPLPERKQHVFSGRLAMGMAPAAEMGWMAELPEAAE